MENVELNSIEERVRLLNEAKLYLAETDWYYARKLETGEDVPDDVVAKRLETREFLRYKGY